MKKNNKIIDKDKYNNKSGGGGKGLSIQDINKKYFGKILRKSDINNNDNKFSLFKST